VDDRRLYFLLALAAHRVQRHADGVLVAELGITAVQCGALLYLRQHDGCLQKDLGAGLGLASSGTTGLVARLERAGLIEREDDAADGRAVRLRLSRAGRRAVERALPLVREMQGALSDGFTAQELEVVARFLGRAIDRFTTAEDPGEAR
jgi:DNA-binding MarR family transcriptional regulator